MIPTPLGEHAVPTPLAHTPHALIDVPVGVDHSALAVRLIVEPQPIIPIAGLIEHGAPALLPILFPVARVLPPELIFAVGHPQRALAVPLILDPPALVLISILVVLDAEALLLVVSPVADVLVAANPFRRFFRPVFIELLFLR